MTSADYQMSRDREAHAALEAQLAEQLSRPRPDLNEVKRLKLSKLRVKERLEGVRPAGRTH